MSKSLYRFEICNNKGKVVKKFTRRCDNIRASEFVQGLLNATHNATSVFGIEEHGHAVHSAYRD